MPMPTCSHMCMKYDAIIYNLCHLLYVKISGKINQTQS